MAAAFPVAAPGTASTSSSADSIELSSVIVGDCTFSVVVDRDASIPTLLDTLRAKLAELRLPSEVTPFTSVERTGAWLQLKSPEHRRIQQRDLRMSCQFTTPSAKLDPTKTVADYFGAAPQDLRVVHLVLVWSVEATNERKADIERMRVRIQAELASRPPPTFRETLPPHAFRLPASRATPARLQPPAQVLPTSQRAPTLTPRRRMDTPCAPTTIVEPPCETTTAGFSHVSVLLAAMVPWGRSHEAKKTV